MAGAGSEALRGSGERAPQSIRQASATIACTALRQEPLGPPGIQAPIFQLAHFAHRGATTWTRTRATGTAEIAAGGKTAGLRFLGHVVVAGDEWPSIS